MEYRRSDIIDIIAKTDGRSEHSATQKVKAPVILDMLQPIEKPERFMRDFPLKEVIRARLLIAAQDAAGLRFDDLHIVNDKLNERLGHGEWPDNGIANSSGLDAIINAAKNDVVASIEIEIGYCEGRKVIRAAVNLENWRCPFRAWDALDASEGVNVLATTTIPASRLAREVIEVAHE